MEDWIFYIILGVIVVVFVCLIMAQSRRRRQAQTEYTGMLDTLRSGMRVKTVGGVIGRIREIREEAPGFKTVLLETGDAKNPSLVTYDLQAIYGIVDDEAIMQKQMQQAAEQQPAAIQNHEPANDGVDNAQNASKPKETKPKGNTTKKQGNKW